MESSNEVIISQFYVNRIRIPGKKRSYSRALKMYMKFSRTKRFIKNLWEVLWLGTHYWILRIFAWGKVFLAWRMVMDGGELG